MLDIEPKWFIALIIIFLADIAILNVILFRPMLKVFKEREAAIDGALDLAKEMDADRETKLTTFKREMSDASVTARAKFDSLRQVGMDKQKVQMEAAAKDAGDLIVKARKELTGESDKARAALKGDVEKFSDEIAEKLMKVVS